MGIAWTLALYENQQLLHVIEVPGSAELGRQSVAKAHYAAERLDDMSGATLLFPDSDFFKEFALAVVDPVAVRRALIDKGFLVGPVVDGGLIVSVTERRTRAEIDELVKAFEEVLS